MLCNDVLFAWNGCREPTSKARTRREIQWLKLIVGKFVYKYVTLVFVAVACPVLVSGVDAVMAHFVNREYTYMESVAFTCMEGYEYSSGSDNRSCQADATWSGSPFICTRGYIIVYFHLNESAKYLHNVRKGI